MNNNNNNNNNPRLLEPLHIAKKVDFGLIKKDREQIDSRTNILANFCRPFKNNVNLKDSYALFVNTYFFDYDILDIDPTSLIERTSKILGYQTYFLIIVYAQYGEIKSEKINSDIYPHCEINVIHTSFDELFSSGLMHKIYLENDNSTLAYRTIMNFRGLSYFTLQAAFRAKNVILSGGSSQKRHILNPFTHRFSQFISAFESYNLNGVINSFHNVKPIELEPKEVLKAALGPKIIKDKNSIGDISTKAFDKRWRAIFKKFFNQDLPIRESKNSVSAKKIDANVSTNTQNNDSLSLSENNKISQVTVNLNQSNKDKEEEMNLKQDGFDFANDPWVDSQLLHKLYNIDPVYKKLYDEKLKKVRFETDKQITNQLKNFADQLNQIEKDKEQQIQEDLIAKEKEKQIKQSRIEEAKVIKQQKEQAKEIKKNNRKIASLEVGEEKENIIKSKASYPDLSKEENPLGLSKILYSELIKEREIEAEKAKKAENKHYETILTPDQYRQYLFLEASAKEADKVNEKIHADSILTPEEIKEKRIKELQEMLNNSSIYLIDADREDLNRELKSLLRKSDNKNNSGSENKENNTKSNKKNNSDNKRHFSTFALNQRRNYHTSSKNSLNNFNNDNKGKDVLSLLKTDNNELKGSIENTFEDNEKNIKLFSFLDYVRDVLNDETLTTYEKQTKIETEWMENIKFKLLDPEFSKTRLSIYITRAFNILQIQLGKKNLKLINVLSDDFKTFLIKIESLILTFGYIITYCSRMNYTYIASLIGNALFWEFFRHYNKTIKKADLKLNPKTKNINNYDLFYSENNFNEEQAVRLGDLLIECFIRIEIIDRRFDIEDKGKAYIEIRQDCINEIVENTFIVPTSLPMCHKPNEWSDDKRGGFLSNTLGKGKGADLIQGSALREKHLIENKKELFYSINYLDSIKFKINKDFLDFILNEGYYLLSSEDEKNWTQNLISIKIAQTFINTPFYINTFADWRGRIYTNSFFISYQGSNLAKNLIYFNEGEILKEKGFDYLYIYGANAYNENGLAKKSINERINWVQVNYQKILKMEKEFLINAKEKFTFAAFCLVIRKLHQNHKAVIHLPIFLDATCSGIQHLAALMKDLDSASRVNLIEQNNDQPVADIYSDVVGPVNEALNKFGLENKQTHSHFTKIQLTRVEIKSLVMTKPYNASIFGMTQQLARIFEITEKAKEFLKKKIFLKTKINSDFDDNDAKDLVKIEEENYDPYIYIAPALGNEKVLLSKKDLYLIAKIVDNQVFMMFPALKEIYDYLLDISKVLRDLNIPITWFTPAGIKITQHYLKEETHNYYMRSGNTRKTIILKNKIKNVNNNEYVVDRRKQVESIIPNVIHSLDASHLMFVIRECINSNILPIITVHDCFGTLPNQMFHLEQVVKKQFVYLYTKENFLNKFHKKLLDSIEDNNYIIFKKGERKGRKDKIIELLKTFDNANIKKSSSTTGKIKESNFW
jgi:DNA-dependent RNA polymerase